MIGKKVLVSLIIVGLVGFALGWGTYSQFSDTETTTTVFTAGSLNLKVGNDDPVQWKIELTDLLPGCSGSQSVTINNTGTVNGKLSISFSNLIDQENGLTEPEIVLGDSEPDGELAENLYLKITIDGTTVYEGYASGVLSGGITNYVLNAGASKTFTVEYSIAGSVGNIIQSDVVGFTITFLLTQA
jgi:predicted ribosomally synthesized peptide with SipW-like signal peptide